MRLFKKTKLDILPEWTVRPVAIAFYVRLKLIRKLLLIFLPLKTPDIWSEFKSESAIQFFMFSASFFNSFLSSPTNHIIKK